MIHQKNMTMKVNTLKHDKTMMSRIIIILLRILRLLLIPPKRYLLLLARIVHMMKSLKQCLVVLLLHQKLSFLQESEQKNKKKWIKIIKLFLRINNKELKINQNNLFKVFSNKILNFFLKMIIKL